MFKSKARELGGEYTLLGTDAFFRGDIESQGSVRLDGTLEGQVTINGDLYIGDNGRLKGNAVAHNIIVAGRVEGNLQARGRIEIMTSGYIEGDVTSETLVIDEGGILKGCSHMEKNKKPAVINGSEKNKKEKGNS